jgi:DNA adenine methylase
MDSTALERQNRRIARLKKQGVSRATVLVHEECKPALNGLKAHLLNPIKAKVLTALLSGLRDERKPINVAQVRQLSPFRYPGGKTWLVPEVRDWLTTSNKKPSIFVEPFAGGAMAGLTAAAEGLAKHVFLCELDDDVAAVWKAIFSGTGADIRWLCNRILTFQITLKNVLDVLAGTPKTNREWAFRTIVKNRMQRGGIMAPGAGLVKSGEAGRGLMSRWYPETISERIKALHSLRHVVTFRHGDAIKSVKEFSKDPDACFFIDPPYTAGGKKAGRRLYTHNEIDHEALFKVMAKVKGSVMMTYDDTLEVRKLALEHKFRLRSIPMKNTHHEIISELLILKP